jgi:sugar O-acyltransferase (sialic acid O-acetyltransferase NeuD family)
MTPRPLIILGAGGFAREVRWLLGDLHGGARFAFAGYAVSDLARLGPHDSRDEVVGDFDWLATHRDRFSALAFGIGNPAVKHRIAEQLDPVLPDIEWPSLIHASVRLDHASATLGRGVVICAGVLGTVALVLHEFAMVNLGCTLGHEASLGRCAVLNPTVNISGGVGLGERVLVGTGAQVLQYVNIGDDATIGAGAVVTKDVPAGATVVGIPAKAVVHSGTK